MTKHKLTLWATGGAMLMASNALFAVVNDDLLTNSNGGTGWQNCGGSNLNTETDTVAAFDPSHLEEDGCAYRETPAVAGEQYKMTCGVSSFKYSSMTLSFLDENDTTLASQSTEILEDVQGGAYSVTLVAPAGTTTAAVGIYGLAGSGFQDCTLLLDNPDTGPEDGSISGVTWFDEDGNTQLANSENMIPSTPVSIFLGDALIDQTTTGLEGEYYFGGLDLDACYRVVFAPADPTLTLTSPGGDNAAVNNGSTLDICLSGTTPNVVDIDAGFIAVPPVVPPEDYAVCGLTWLSNPDANDENTVADVAVTLTNIASGEQQTVSSGDNGSFSFSNLPGGDYKIQFGDVSGHTFIAGDSALTADSSFAGTDGMTPQFNLPNDGNTGEDDACTLRNANAGLNRTEVALDPTFANDDEIEGIVGENLSVLILGNDEPCNGEVMEVDLLGHNVPGNVTYDAASGAFMISDTTASGTYTIDYGLRGTCGSHDTAVVTVVIAEVPTPPVPNGPEAPVDCRASLGKITGSEPAVHIDIYPAEGQTVDELSPQYNFYDADMNLVYTGLLTEGGRWNGAVFWRKREHGVEVLDIVYVTAVENGLESPTTPCIRRKTTPIAIDIDRNGQVESISGDFTFDTTGDGNKERLMEWFSPSDGILINKDFGASITGEHLFGDTGGKHVNGFTKLALEDHNNDGQISGKELKNLAIWTDSNSNTAVDPGEISSLASHSIESLAVEHYKYAARAVLMNGDTLLMRDLWFPIHPIEQASR